MDRKEHLLTCLAEECVETAQRVSKALRFGLGEVQPGQDMNNAARIIQELQETFAVAEILADEGILEPVVRSLALKKQKMEKIERFMAISREQGVLSE